MKIKNINQFFGIFLLLILLWSVNNGGLSAVTGVDPKIHYVNHMMGFKGNPSSGDNEYDLLHNLMSTNSNVEFDVSANKNSDQDLFIWHVAKSDRLHENFENTPTKKLISQKVVLFNEFMKKYNKNFKTFTIETKNFDGNHKLLDKFLKIIRPWKAKIEIESMKITDLSYMRKKGFNNTSLILLNSKANFSKKNNRNIKKWIKVARTLLISPKSVRTKKQIINLRRFWGGKRLGFWTLDPAYENGKIIKWFNNFYQSEKKNYKSIYYMSDANDDNVTKNNLYYFNLVKQISNINVRDYMINLLGYKNGIILSGKTNWEKSYMSHEKNNIDYRNDFKNIVSKFLLPKNIENEIYSNKAYKFNTYFDFENDKSKLCLQLIQLVNKYDNNILKIIPNHIFNTKSWYKDYLMKKIDNS